MPSGMDDFLETPPPFNSFLTSYTPPFGATSIPTSTPQALEDKTKTTATTPTYPASYSPTPTSSSTSSSGPQNPFASVVSDHVNANKDFWDRMSNGTKTAATIAIVIGVLVIVGLSMWYCCGCCGLRAKRRKRRQGLEDANTNRSVPLYTVNSQSPGPRPDARGIPPGDAPPPTYEEAVPPRHQRVEGGITHVREEEEGIISDGKTPLSEIPFEDVVLDHSPSEGSARGFGDRHHGLGGDTRGHTNS